MPAKDVQADLKEAVDKILASKSRKKLVVAGPGAGKTTLFQKLLEAAAGQRANRLVLTFINNLKDDLERALGGLSQVFTLHSYCQHLLKRHEALRGGLSANFRCFPGLRSIIPIDWMCLRETDAPPFVEQMRHLNCSDDLVAFYIERTNFYDAVDFDDSVYRTLKELVADQSRVPEYALVLIDEFQDFNKVEAAIIDVLSKKNPIVVAGDDDQALYSQLRGASWDHIRAHHSEGHYEIFELPFCMRCTEVVVDAVNDVIKRAQTIKKLDGRIPKSYRYYPPVKGDDSARFPHIDLVETSVQRENANYFGRYIERCIRAIPAEEAALATEKNEPVALIIGSNPYRRSVEKHLVRVGLIIPKADDELSERERALRILNQDPHSKLGWRIILAHGDPGLARSRVRKAANENRHLEEVIPDAERDAILKEAAMWVATHGAEEEEEATETVQSVAVTSYEGSKGRSAQYVFLIGVHSGELPGNPAAIKDIEICRFLVGLTRTKKQCTILIAKNAMGQYKKPSEFLGWISAARFQKKKVDNDYWVN